MDFTSVFTSVIVMGFMIGVGTLLKRTIVFNKEAKQLLTGIIVNVALPCIILYSIFQFPMDANVFQMVLITFISSIFLNLTGIGIGWSVAKLMRVPKQRAKEMAIVSGFGNTGFIGLPLCATLFGPKGALLAAVFDAGLDFTIWTAGVLLLQKSATFSIRSLKSVINLPMIAIVVGLTLGYLNFNPPNIILMLTGNLANLASPLAMIYIGLLVPTLWKKRGTISKIQLSVPLFLKLIIFPVVATIFLYFTALDSEITQVVLVQATMPTITIASILFARYEANVEFGAATTVVSTIISLATIPLMVYICSLII